MTTGSQESATLGLGDLVLGIDHVGIATADLDASTARYALLGFRETHRETNPDQQVCEVMLACGDDGPTASTRLQLLAPTSPDSTIAAFLDRRGPGLQQLALRVRDLDRACDELRTRGVRLIYDSPRRGTGGARINFVHPRDAGGVLIELTEPTQPPSAHTDEGDPS